MAFPVSVYFIFIITITGVVHPSDSTVDSWVTIQRSNNISYNLHGIVVIALQM